MLVYVDQENDKVFEDYDSIEQKNKIVDGFHNMAKEAMRIGDHTQFRYAIIDFHKDQSTVFIMNRQVTETFSITGC